MGAILPQGVVQRFLRGAAERKRISEERKLEKKRAKEKREWDKILKGGQKSGRSHRTRSSHSGNPDSESNALWMFILLGAFIVFVIFNGNDEGSISGSDGESSKGSNYSTPVSRDPSVPIRRIAAPGEVNVREGPGTSYGIISKVKDGEIVGIYREYNGWTRVDDGWVNSSYIQDIEGN